MRVHPWIVSILSVMALSAGQSGFAQYEGMGIVPGQAAGGPYYPGGNPGYPGGEGFVPPPPGTPAGVWDPIAAGQNGGPGYDPNRSPWPGISPFENRFAEHTHENELWFFRSNNSPRRYYANADYRYAHYRRPDQTRVGNEIAPQNNRIAGIPAPFLPVDTGVLYDSFLGNFVGLPTATTGGNQQNQRPTVNNVAVKEQHLESDPRVNGFQLTWGFTEPSDQGLQLSGWYTPEAHWAYSRGYNPSRLQVVTETNFNLGLPLAITNALPVNDGLPDGPNGKVNGDYIVYDRFFGLDFTSVGGGGEINWNFTPFWRGDWYQFAPTAGLQMLFIGETFSFNGADSGGGLVFNVPPGLEDPSTYLQVVTPFESQIMSEINSYLFGPQVGLRFEIGGDNLKIGGHTQVGLSMNHERMELTSFGVGNGFGSYFDQTTQFREEQHHTVLSPTTIQELTAEARVFQFIPFVNRLHFMEDATLRVGYQLNAAFNIQRPNRTVEYNGFPLIPAIRTDQATRWYSESWNFGINWIY